MTAPHVQFILDLVLGKEDIKCDVMLHTHLEVEALPHATLARLWQFSCFHWLVVSGIKELPQKLPTAQQHLHLHLQNAKHFLQNVCNHKILKANFIILHVINSPWLIRHLIRISAQLHLPIIWY